MEKVKTLYELIGDDRLQDLINSFYAKVFDSPILAPLFNQTNADIIKDKQFSFLTQFLGGPPRYMEKYGPPQMRRRHMPHAITNEAKDEWLSLMQISIQELDLADNLKTALYNCFPKVAQHMVNS
ncbi:MAG: globin [Crocinitomix sp.]|nr:globin [Crocinitomix sp.]